MTASGIQGRILHLQRLSTEDGPGIRTTVFFKGCPLRCEWCHNPESLSAGPQTQWFAVRCIGCNTCLTACPNSCLSRCDVSSPLVIDRARCQGCGTCAAACPSGALETLGRTATVEELLDELVKDRAYYEKSGGGVTLSGGEPTFQPDFAEALLRGLKTLGISTALDTCGLCSVRTLDRLLPHVDLVLYDLKLSDAEQHRRLTGQPNGKILENLRHVRDWITSQSRPVGLWIRTPLIPGATTSPENLSSLGRIIAEELDSRVDRWELCAFNNLCRDQYLRLGLEWAYAKTPLMSAGELETCREVAGSSEVSREIIHVTGATRTTDTSTCS